MSFDTNQRAIRPNENLENLQKRQIELLQKIFDKLDDISGIMVENGDTMIDQNSQIKSKLDDVNVNLTHVVTAVETIS